MVAAMKLTSGWCVSEEMFQKGLLRKEENATFKKKPNKDQGMKSQYTVQKTR